MEIENRCVEIKATLQKLTDVKNPTARLIAVLMACGVTATSELAELVGVGERAIQKARKLLPQANENSRTTVRNEPQFANHSSPPEPQFAENEPWFAPRAHAPAQMESPTGISLSQEVEDTPLTPNVDQLGRPIEGPEAEIFLARGKLHVIAGQRQFWLRKFDGDEKRLDLALIEIAPKLLPHGRQPIYAQVGSQLARIAGQRHDQQQRYEAARATPAASKHQANAEHMSRLMAIAREAAA